MAVEHPFEVAMIGFDVTDWQFDGGPAEGDWVTFLVPSPTGLKVYPPKAWTDADNAGLDTTTTEAGEPGYNE